VWGCQLEVSLKRLAVLAFAIALLAPVGANAAVIQTKPIVKNAVMVVNGVSFHANDAGLITIPDALLRMDGGVPGNVRMAAPKTPLRRGGYAEFSRWFGTQGGRRPLTAAFRTFYPFNFRFLGPEGRRIERKDIHRMSIRSGIGEVKTRVGADIHKPWTLEAQRVVSRQGGPVISNVQYRVRSVLVSGTNVVTQSRESFYPATARYSWIDLIYFKVKFTAFDAFFKFPIGDGVIITYPDGRQEMRAFEKDGQILIPALPRGRYQVSVDAPGFSFTRPLALTRDQDVKLQVISYVDIAVVLLLLMTLAITLVVYPRRHRFGFGGGGPAGGAQTGRPRRRGGLPGRRFRRLLHLTQGRDGGEQR
jgi:hypothetical protein